MTTFRGASGFGDAIYLYPAIKWWLTEAKLDRVELLTDYPGVYDRLIKNHGLITRPRGTAKADRECRYGSRYADQSTTTYQDTLFMAGAPDNLPLEIDYESSKTFDFPGDKKLCIIRVPTIPMRGKPDGIHLIPDNRIIQRIIDDNKKDFYFILAGNIEKNYRLDLNGIDFDLTGQLKACDLFKLISLSDMVLAQCGFFLPMCEALNKKCFVLYSSKAQKITHPFFNYIRPQKTINKYNLIGYAWDDEPINEILKTFKEKANG